jgi:hypothetical protein
LGVWVGFVDPNTQISDFSPPRSPIRGEKGGRGDERGKLSAPEPETGEGYNAKIMFTQVLAHLREHNFSIVLDIDKLIK